MEFQTDLKDVDAHAKKHKALLCLLCCGLLLTASAVAHDNAEHSSNASTDALIAHSNSTVQSDAPVNPANVGNAALAAETSVPGQRTDASVYGRWSDVENWPVLAVHAALLPNGRVMAWDATPDDFDDDPHTTENYTTRVTVWDPVTGRHLSTPNDTNADLFCAGSAHLWDGRVLFAGGDSGKEGRNGPLSNSSLYDPWTNTWTQSDSMAAPRWYSSVAALSNGELLTFGGTYSPRPIAEVFKFNQQWRSLPVRVPFTVSGDYSWLQARSSGDVMYLGPHNTLSTIDTALEGSWNSGPERDDESYRGYGSYALFDVDKVLVAGGGDSTASSVVIDMATQVTTPTDDLTIGRRQHNLTILADGSVLATGGNSSGASLLDLDNGVMTPELWRPDTGKWQAMADMAITRQYHSTALLLADGRVLSAGGGYCAICGDEGYHEQNAEIFSPPYLYDVNSRLKPRPVISNVPQQINYATPFVVQNSAPATIKRAHLIKLGSVTHSQNQDQRLVPVRVRAIGGNLLLTSPENRDIAPPGHYLLFVVDENGTPSTGHMILVGQPLITDNEVVVNTVRANHWDYYAIEGKGQHTLTVYLQGSLENVELVLNAEKYPTLSEPTGRQFSCASNTNQLGGKLCTVTADIDTTWYIGVYGNQRTDYSLVAHLDDINDDATIPVIKPSESSPSRPFNVRANILSATDVDLSWNQPTDETTILNYEVYRNGRLIAVENNQAHQARRLQPSKRYIYQIVAVDVQQNRSAATLGYPVATLPDPDLDLDAFFHPDIPSAPNDVRIRRYSETSLEVFWEPSFDNGFITGYEIYRDDVLLDTREGVSYFDDSLQPAEEYTYTIVAVDNERHRSLPSTASEIELPVAAEPPVEAAPVVGPDTVDTNEIPVDEFPAEDFPVEDDFVIPRTSGGTTSLTLTVILLFGYLFRLMTRRHQQFVIR